MEKLVLALGELADSVVILIIFSGVSAGLFVGAMPGLTATMALAVLLPFTFTLPPLFGLVALGAVYMGAIYGGSFAAILVNTPGTPSSIATAFEGYPMSRQGRALEAISGATIASAIGVLLLHGLRLFENLLSWILIGMVVFSAAWPYLAALYRRLQSPGMSKGDDP